MPYSEQKQKAFEAAVDAVVVAQNRLMMHQVEMQKLRTSIIAHQTQMNAFAAIMSTNPAAAHQHIDHMNKWIAATMKMDTMYKKEPKLTMALERAQAQLNKAANDLA